MNHKASIIFDLDDTLYKERDFLVSAFCAIAQRVEAEFGISSAFSHMYETYLKQGDAFQGLIDLYHLPLEKEWFLQIYRNHAPSLSLAPEVQGVLQELYESGYNLGLITDGRSLTQRNKLSALGLEKFIPNEAIVISEEFGSTKPEVRNYAYFMELYKTDAYLYVGDNPKKDFITPNRLGWHSILLRDDGRNIHSQDIPVPEEYKATCSVRSLTEIKELLQNISNHE